MGIWNLTYFGLWMVQKRLGCKWSGFWMGSEIWKPNHLKSRQMAAILSKTIWNLDKNIRIWNGPDFKLSDFRYPLYPTTRAERKLSKALYGLIDTWAILRISSGWGLNKFFCGQGSPFTQCCKYGLYDSPLKVWSWT